MYLVNVETLKIEYFAGDATVPYAILSHRWEEEELTMQEMQGDIKDQKKGRMKLLRTCEQAQADGIGYVWVDTCCIDKTSSAELSEAINSMFKWYENSTVCYAYLSDVNERSELETSLWFTRGWTLQELLAPSGNMVFFSKDWKKIGTKSSLDFVLFTITGIPSSVVSKREGFDFRLFSVAQRMSWAANRKTTRPEDRAYSLMGLFDVNMPLLYGEGEKAFIRLQEEIIRHSDDQSIFAWNLTIDTPSGLLAPSPDQFQDCSNIRKVQGPVNHQPFSITNKGLSLAPLVMPWTMSVHVAVLDCGLDTPEGFGIIGIFLRPSREPGQYARVIFSGKHQLLFDGGFPDATHQGNSTSTTLKSKPAERGEILKGIGAISMTNCNFDDQSSLDESEMKDRKEISNNPLLRSNFRAWSHVPNHMRAKAIPKHLFVRQNPLEVLPPTNQIYGFWIRKFEPWHTDAKFSFEEHVIMRTWNRWEKGVRHVTVREGHEGPACLILVGCDCTVRNQLSRFKPKCKGHVSFVMKIGFTEDFEPACYLRDISNPRELRDIEPGNYLSKPNDLEWLKTIANDAEILSHDDWKEPSQHFSKGHTYRTLTRKEGQVQIFFKLGRVDNSISKRVWTIDVLYVAKHVVCSECKAVFTRLTNRLYCLKCEKFVCCPTCFTDQQTNLKWPHSDHQFRATGPPDIDLDFILQFRHPSIAADPRLENFWQMSERDSGDRTVI